MFSPFLRTPVLASTGSCRLEKYSQLESWVMFYLMGIFRTSSPGGNVSGHPERTAPKRQEGRGSHVTQKFCSKGQVVCMPEDGCSLTESQISQVKAFSAFPRVRRCKSLGSLTSSLRRGPPLSGPLACVLPSWVPSGLTSSPSEAAAASVTPLVHCPSQPATELRTEWLPGAGPLLALWSLSQGLKPLPKLALGGGIGPACSCPWPAPRLAPVSRTGTSPRWLWASSFSRTSLPNLGSGHHPSLAPSPRARGLLRGRVWGPPCLPLSFLQSSHHPSGHSFVQGDSLPSEQGGLWEGKEVKLRPHREKRQARDLARPGAWVLHTAWLAPRGVGRAGWHFCAIFWLFSRPAMSDCFCDPVDCSPPGSSVHADAPGENTGVGAISSSGGYSARPRGRTQTSSPLLCHPFL